MKQLYIQCIAGKLGIQGWQVENCVRLFDEGATIPFISRYRKEKTGGEKKKLFPENIGIAVTDYLTESFPDIVDYGFTARAEEDFDRIAEGKSVWNKMIADFYSNFHKSVEESLVERAPKIGRASCRERV